MLLASVRWARPVPTLPCGPRCGEVAFTRSAPAGLARKLIQPPDPSFIRQRAENRLLPQDRTPHDLHLSVDKAARIRLFDSRAGDARRRCYASVTKGARLPLRVTASELNH